jgi:hypothetical protein
MRRPTALQSTVIFSAPRAIKVLAHNMYIRI